MGIAFEHDRGAQWLMAADDRLDPEAAAARLDGAALVLSFDESLTQADVQAGLLAAVAAGKRMFRRGVFLGTPGDAPCALPLQGAGSFRRRLILAGAQDRASPPGASRLHVGADGPAETTACWTDGWTAWVGRGPAPVDRQPGNAFNGTLAAALGLQEVFRRHVLLDLRAGRRKFGVNAWGPDAPASAVLPRLPNDLWILGLGNLGQAALFVLGTLPYWDPHEVRLLLQDFDTAGPENTGVQVLTEPAWIGQRKSRRAAAWAETLGFRIDLCERAFVAGHGPGREEPRTLLGCVDNLPARRAASGAGFDLVVDAGLGASAAEAFDIRLHAFPGRRTAQEAWPETAPAAPKLSAGLERALAAGQIDLCGAMTIAGRSVGVPCTALAAAALQITQVVRAMETGSCCDLADLSLPLADEAVFKLMETGLARPPGFAKAWPA